MSDPAAESPRKPRRLTRGRWILIGFGAALLLLLLAPAIRKYYMSWQIEKELAAIRAEGLPTTLEELEAWYPEVPDGENAAILYEKAFENMQPPYWFIRGDTGLRITERGMTILKDCTYPIVESFQPKIAEYLERNRKAVRLCQEAAAHPKCRHSFHITLHGQFMYGIDIKPQLELEPDRPKDPIFTVHLLGLESWWQAGLGNMDKSALAMIDSLRLLRSFQLEPWLTTQENRLRDTDTLLGLLVTIMGRERIPEPYSRILSDELASHESSDGVRRGLIGYRCAVMERLEDMKTGQTSKPMRNPMQRLIMGASGYDEETSLLALQNVQEALKALRFHPKDRLEALQNLARRVGQKPATFWLVDKVGESNDWLAGENLTPEEVAKHKTKLDWWLSAEGKMVRLIVKDITILARLRAARTALAVDRFRDARGRLPDALAELVPDFLPAVPEDPFAGAPMRYQRKAPKGFSVYSVGLNGRDDGGVEPKPVDPDSAPPPPGDAEPDDIIFPVDR